MKSSFPSATTVGAAAAACCMGAAAGWLAAQRWGGASSSATAEPAVGVTVGGNVVLASGEVAPAGSASAVPSSSGAGAAAGAGAGAAAHAGDDDIYAEQYSRNRLLFGEQGQATIHKSFVIVVGVGGVGSHAAHMLARSGVEHIRLIDFDQVTVSSLNRHAFAHLADVGTSKVAAAARHVANFAPRCKIDQRPVMFTRDAADELLAGNPSFVLDCIDDADTKKALIMECLRRKLPFLSACSAGAKVDPTRIHIADIHDAIKDPLARKIRFLLRKDADNMPPLPEGQDVHSIPVVYSSEKAVAKLTHLSQGHIDSPQEFGAVDNFRTGVLPVLGTIPAMFGTAMASYVLCKLGGQKLIPVPVQRLGNKRMLKMFQAAKNRERKVYGATETLDLTVDELEYGVRHVWGYRSAISGIGMLQGKSQLVTRWIQDEPLTLSNLILASRDEAAALKENGLSSLDPALVARVTNKLRAVHVEDMCLS